MFFHPTKEFFTHFETSPLQVKGCKFLLNVALKANEQWVSLVWHVYCDAAHRFIWSSLRICDTWAFSSWAFATCLNDLGLLWPRFEDPTFHMRGKHSIQLHHHCNTLGMSPSEYDTRMSASMQINIWNNRSYRKSSSLCAGTFHIISYKVRQEDIQLVLKNDHVFAVDAYANIRGI